MPWDTDASLEKQPALMPARMASISCLTPMPSAPLHCHRIILQEAWAVRFSGIDRGIDMADQSFASQYALGSFIFTSYNSRHDWTMASMGILAMLVWMGIEGDDIFNKGRPLSPGFHAFQMNPASSSRIYRSLLLLIDE